MRFYLPPWLSPAERLAVNQLVIGSNPIGGATTLSAAITTLFEAFWFLNIYWKLLDSRKIDVYESIENVID